MSQSEVERVLREALQFVAVRWSPTLDGYCWCSRKVEPSEHKPYCVMAKAALAAADGLRAEHKHVGGICIICDDPRFPEGKKCSNPPLPPRGGDERLSKCCKSKIVEEDHGNLHGVFCSRCHNFCEVIESAPHPLPASQGDAGGTRAMIVSRLAGSASLCWNPKPSGVFDATAAGKFVDEALVKLAALSNPPGEFQERECLCCGGTGFYYGKPCLQQCTNGKVWVRVRK